MSFGSERTLNPGFAPTRAVATPGYASFQSAAPLAGGVSPADPAFAQFYAQYIRDWSDREMTWGLQGLMEAVARAQGTTLPGTMAQPGATPFDLPTAPVSATPGTTPSSSQPRDSGDWQALADELGVSPRKAQRITRQQQRAERTGTGAP